MPRKPAPETPAPSSDEVLPRILASVLDAVQAPIFVKDDSLRWIYANPALLQGLGRTREDILGRTDFEIFSEKQARLFRLRDEDVLARGATRRDETEIVWNGRASTILSIKSLFRDPESGRAFILGHVQDVSELKRTLAALDESEIMHRSIATLAPVAIVLHRDGVILWANPAAAAFYGATEPADMIGADLRDRLTEEGRQALDKRMRLARDSGRMLPSLEYEIKGQDGRPRTVEGRIGIVPHQGGQALLSIFQDVTEARRTAKALEQSESTLRAVFNNVHSAVFLHGPDGTILDVNDRMLELFGVTREQARRMSIAEDFSAPDAEFGRLPGIWRTVMSGGSLTFDWKSRRPGDGSVFDVEVHLRRVDLPVGSRILATVTDITDRKKALAALTESELRYRSLFEKANDCIALIRGGRIVECNQRVVEILGLPRERILGAPAGDFTPEHQPCGRRSAEMAEEHLARAAAGENLLFEWRHLRADGSEFDAEVSLSLVEPGPPPLLQAIMRDVSERKRNLEALTLSEARYRTLARNFPNGTVLLFDSRMRFLLAGGLGLEALGLVPEDIVGRTPREFFPPDMAPRVEEVFRQALAGQTSLSELTFADRSYEVRTVPVTGAGGRVTGGMSVSQDISARKRLEEQLRHQALHDPLTGLANRTLCLDRIRQAVERSRRRPDYIFAVLFVDLDRFKLVNDSMGHKFGDALLMETASRLLECVRDLDTVARLGGDEFVLVLEELEAPRRAIHVVHRVREVLAREFQLGQRAVQLTASIGVAVDTRRYRTPEDVLQNANLAMHRAKEMGRDRFKIFTNRMLDAAVHRLNLESGLQRALAENQLFLVYQPIVRLGRGYGLYGFEALVRWRHPERGVVGPAEFIPVAEETGLIVELGLWVLRAACRTFADWLRGVPDAADLTLAVNLSGRQFAQSDLVGAIRRVLQETGMPADKLKLEITETALMENASRAVERLQALRDLGIRLSVDDFGTGYSNMIYLQQLPLDLLKIDLSFVQKMDVNQENVAIVKAIISLAHTLGLEVVAEGVERARHHEILSLLDCEFGQGYLYSPPLSEDDARTFIRGFRDRPGPT